MRTISLIMLGLVMLSSCKKEKEAECFDAALKQHYQKIACTQDCPGIVGCDGKNYCNECMANQNGIRIEK